MKNIHTYVHVHMCMCPIHIHVHVEALRDVYFSKLMRLLHRFFF